MKLLFTLTIVVFSYCVDGQNIKLKPVSVWQPVYFLDSVRVDIQQLHFDPEKIANINVISNYYDSTEHVHGEIFMTSKDKNAYNFLTIPDIARISNNNSKGPTLYMLDNEFLKDISSFKIDSSYILTIQITKGSEIEYLKNTFPDLTVFKILTRTKENLKNENKIIIRGTEQTTER